jgi:phage shock protein A
MSSCRRWNEKPTAEKTWTQFKSHFAATHRQHKQMQGESAATAGYHSANAAVNQNEDQMAESTIGALANLATATAADRGVVAALTLANSCLKKQLEDTSTELRELKALLIRNGVTVRAQKSSTHRQVIIVGHVATMLVRHTRAALATSPNPDTKQRQLEPIT